MSIRVLIVEDSVVVAEFLGHIIDSDPALRVVGNVRNGLEALRAVESLKPDVITMDIAMPVMDGYEATRRIMETHPVPIVIVSLSIDPAQVATTVRALEAGALAAVPKPLGIGHPDYQQAADALVRTVKLMSEVKVVRRWPMHHKAAPWQSPASLTENMCDSGRKDIKVVAMGASTGGPSVLQTILSGLPENYPASVLVVQHISPGFIEGFAESLSLSCRLSVRIPGDGEILMPGTIYLAPDGAHMEVSVGGRVKLSESPLENGIRPSISCLFRSVATVFGPCAVGVLLTGMGNDGAEGLKLMREKGAITIAQDGASCVVFGMPAEAIRLGAALHVFSPDQIASFLAKLMRAGSVQQL